MSRLGLDKRFARGSKVLLDRLVHTQVHTLHVVDSAKAVHAHARSVGHLSSPFLERCDVSVEQYHDQPTFGLDDLAAGSRSRWWICGTSGLICA
jgi:hypothetical protein